MKEKKENKISIEQLNYLLNRYNIGKKSLAKLLGWGEGTIIRYSFGKKPSTIYSDYLKDLSENPMLFYQVLLKNQDRLSQSNFYKSYQAVLKCLVPSKLQITACYIVNYENGQITSRYLQRLLLYCQIFNMIFLKRELFYQNVCLNQENIPYPEIYKEYNKKIELPDEYIEKSFTQEERKLIYSVLNAFDWFGMKALDLIYQKELVEIEEFCQYENHYILSKELLKKFYQKKLDQYGIYSKEEINKYPVYALKQYGVEFLTWVSENSPAF